MQVRFVNAIFIARDIIEFAKAKAIPKVNMESIYAWFEIQVNISYKTWNIFLPLSLFFSFNELCSFVAYI